MHRYLFFLLILGAIGCQQPSERTPSVSATTASEAQQPRTDPAPVTPEEVARLLEAGAQLVDVRTDGEVVQGTVRGATHANINAGGFDKAVATLDKSKPVVTYCAAGVRALRAANRLRDMGFTRVYYVTEGGYSELAATGLPTQ